MQRAPEQRRRLKDEEEEASVGLSGRQHSGAGDPRGPGDTEQELQLLPETCHRQRGDVPTLPSRSRLPHPQPSPGSPDPEPGKAAAEGPCRVRASWPWCCRAGRGVRGAQGEERAWGIQPPHSARLWP